MPQTSKKDRKYRRTKRELSIAYRMLDLVTNQRDQARLTAIGLEQELKKRDTVVHGGSVTTKLADKRVEHIGYHDAIPVIEARQS